MYVVNIPKVPTHYSGGGVRIIVGVTHVFEQQKFSIFSAHVGACWIGTTVICRFKTNVVDHDFLN
jgi:hypothetical protein